MNKKFILSMVIIVLFLTANTANALRWGNDLASVGDLKIQVLKACGKPVSREIIGYIDHVESEKRIRVMKIEEWILEIDLYKTIYYYSLVFEGNKLIEIVSAGEKKWHLCKYCYYTRLLNNTKTMLHI